MQDLVGTGTLATITPFCLIYESPMKHLIAHFTLFLCLTVGGCGVPKQHTQSYGDGYSVITITGGYPHEWSRSSLVFVNAHGQKSEIWPWLGGGPCVQAEIAVFAARVPTGQSEGRWKTLDRIFAVKPTSAPVDLSNEILARWATAAGRNPSEVASSAAQTPMRCNESGLDANFTLFGRAQPEHITVHLDWQQIRELIEDVARTGVRRTEPRWGASWVEKEFK